ncbi:MAG: hypothetical protein WCI74_04055 [Actinomycetes bacterium]
MAAQQDPDPKQMGRQMAALFVALAAAYSIFFAITNSRSETWIFAAVITVIAALICFRVFVSKRS